jgi:hypothetical protein
MNKTNTRRLQYGITIAAIGIALIHLIFPNLKIDAITITLLFIALVPWLSPLFKSLEFPGGWKIEFQEVKEQLETIIAKQTEPITEAKGPTFRIKAYSVNDEATRLVIKALGNPDYTWRYLGGLAAETKLSRKQILESIKWLLDNRLVTEVRGKHETLWGLSADGRDLLRNILGEETTKKIT